MSSSSGEPSQGPPQCGTGIQLNANTFLTGYCSDSDPYWHGAQRFPATELQMGIIEDMGGDCFANDTCDHPIPQQVAVYYSPPCGDAMLAGYYYAQISFSGSNFSLSPESSWNRAPAPSVRPLVRAAAPCAGTASTPALGGRGGYDVCANPTFPPECEARFPNAIFGCAGQRCRIVGFRSNPEAYPNPNSSQPSCSEGQLPHWNWRLDSFVCQEASAKNQPPNTKNPPKDASKPPANRDPCPTWIAVDGTKDELPKVTQELFLRGYSIAGGAVVKMTGEPPIWFWNSATVTETVFLDNQSTTCELDKDAQKNTCSTGTGSRFIIGGFQTFHIEGIPVVETPEPNSFFDLHFVSSPRGQVTPDGCTVTCRQTYTCGDHTYGPFRITYTFHQETVKGKPVMKVDMKKDLYPK